MSTHTYSRPVRGPSRDSLAYAMFIEGYNTRMMDVEAATEFTDRESLDEHLFTEFRSHYRELVTESPDSGSPVSLVATPAKTVPADAQRSK